ncbi:MAG TPA: hypothetical protein VNS58_32350 [Puia sp.]|nr:hypothetical protein [Puia sp.]
MRLPKKCSYNHLTLNLTPLEKKKILEDMSATTCRSFTDYARRKILSKPVTAYYRNQSYDEFTEAYIDFKKDLDAILEKGGLTENEKKWLKEQIKIITDTVVKLYDHVRENRKERPHH